MTGGDVHCSLPAVKGKIMADQKISDMTAATEVMNADEVPIVQAGMGNLKAVRGQLLTGASGEDISLTSSTGQQSQLTTDGADAGVNAVDGGNLEVFGDSVTVGDLPFTIGFQRVGNTVTIKTNSASGAFIDIHNGGTSQLFMDMNTGFISWTGPAGMDFTIDPTLTAGNWAGGLPVNFTDFFERIAAKVKALNGGTPIP